MLCSILFLSTNQTLRQARLLRRPIRLCLLRRPSMSTPHWGNSPCTASERVPAQSDWRAPERRRKDESEHQRAPAEDVIRYVRGFARGDHSRLRLQHPDESPQRARRDAAPCRRQPGESPSDSSPADRAVPLGFPRTGGPRLEAQKRSGLRRRRAKPLDRQLLLHLSRRRCAHRDHLDHSHGATTRRERDSLSVAQTRQPAPLEGRAAFARRSEEPSDRPAVWADEFARDDGAAAHRTQQEGAMRGALCEPWSKSNRARGKLPPMQPATSPGPNSIRSEKATNLAHCLQTRATRI